MLARATIVVLVFVYLNPCMFVYLNPYIFVYLNPCIFVYLSLVFVGVWRNKLEGASTGKDRALVVGKLPWWWASQLQWWASCLPGFDNPSTGFFSALQKLNQRELNIAHWCYKLKATFCSGKINFGTAEIVFVKLGIPPLFVFFAKQYLKGSFKYKYLKFLWLYWCCLLFE